MYTGPSISFIHYYIALMSVRHEQ